MLYLFAAVLVVACILFFIAAWFFGSILALAVGRLLARASSGGKPRSRFSP